MMSNQPRRTLPIVLHNPTILLIGGGKVALQKAEVMLRNEISFSVISDHFIEDFDKITVPKTNKSFSPTDAQAFEIIIDATGNSEVAKTLLALKLEKNFLLNVVDVPNYCDFFFAALIEKGALKVAVSSSGASPTIAQTVRNKIATILPEGLADLTYKNMLDRERGMIEPHVTQRETKKILSKVYLIGCGTGDVELLTIKAYRLIQSVELVLIDKLISDEILALIPPKTKKVYVGKSKGEHSMKQEEINQLLIKYAHEGLTIARLKSGDPFIFGRGSEEALALVEAGIDVEIIPGISSAIAGPSSAGIAPTARGYASGLSIVSAHLANNLDNLDWIDILLKPNHTTIVLMGLSKAQKITEAALAMGVNKALDVALISNASRPNQKTITTTLMDLPVKAQEVERPAIMVFGDVVKLHELLPSFKRNEHANTTNSF